jgi:enoyl-CoA hydratase
MHRLNRIQSHSCSSSSSLSSASVTSDDAKQEVYAERPVDDGGCLFVFLNRPRRLNALTYEMFGALKQLLEVHEADPASDCIVVMSTSAKAFCAGGDMRALAFSSSYAQQLDFVRTEYSLDLCISRLRTPYISLIDGICMGGGCGVSINGRVRVVSEFCRVAMPETAAHWLPDVGGSFFLSHLACKHGRAIGSFLALTGYSMNFVDAMFCGLATHYVPRSKLPGLVQHLRGASRTRTTRRRGGGDYRSDDDAVAFWLAIVDAHTAELPEDGLQTVLLSRLEEIGECFRHESVEGILHALSDLATSSDVDTDAAVWAKQTAANLYSKPPLILKLALHAQVSGRSLGLKECLRMEFDIHRHVLRRGLFAEGVKRLLIDKDYVPVYTHTSLAQVTPQVLREFGAR